MKIAQYYKLWFLISAIFIVPGIIGFSIWKLQPGIDFKGGTMTTVKIDKNKVIDRQQIEESLSSLKLQGLNIQSTTKNTFLIRTATTGGNLDEQINKNLTDKIGESQVLSFESIGPSVSRDTTTRAIIAIIAATLAIIFYLAFEFRKVAKPASSWRFGICAVLALIHDISFVIGAYAILGHFFGYEIDSLFVTALLTIMGFSVHDTIVVFDRIRENLRLSPSLSFVENVNNSILQTVTRSINTQITVLVVLLAMYLLGGDSIKQFVLALFLGIFIGTYSSIFTAAPLLVVWQNWIERRTERAEAS